MCINIIFFYFVERTKAWFEVLKVKRTLEFLLKLKLLNSRAGKDFINILSNLYL